MMNEEMQRLTDQLVQNIRKALQGNPQLNETIAEILRCSGQNVMITVEIGVLLGTGTKAGSPPASELHLSQLDETFLRGLKIKPPENR